MASHSASSAFPLFEGFGSLNSSLSADLSLGALDSSWDNSSTADFDRLIGEVEGVIEAFWKAEKHFEGVPLSPPSFSQPFSNNLAGRAPNSSSSNLNPSHAHLSSVLNSLLSLARESENASSLIPLSVIHKVDEGVHPQAVTRDWIQRTLQKNDEMRGKLVQADLLRVFLDEKLQIWDKKNEEMYKTVDELLKSCTKDEEGTLVKAENAMDVEGLRGAELIAAETTIKDEANAEGEGVDWE